MKPALFDTTVWINYLNGHNTKEAELLEEYIEKGYTVLLCPIILQEILQGIKNDSDYKAVKESLLAFEILEIDHVDAALGAAELYRNLRKKGVTIRKSNDCQIAFYAIHFRVPLAHTDSDFDLIAKYESKFKTMK